jgi:hypothetical protein
MFKLRVGLAAGIAVLTGASAASAQHRQAPDESLHLVSVAGPDVHLRGTPTDPDSGRVQLWWWHFWDANPGDDWNAAAYHVEIDCTALTRTSLRAEFYRDMQFSYGQAGSGIASLPAEPGTAARDLVRGACEDGRDGEPFASPTEAFEVAQTYFSSREPDAP